MSRGPPFKNQQKKSYRPGPPLNSRGLGVISYGNDWERSSHICFGCGNGVPTYGEKRTQKRVKIVKMLNLCMLSCRRKITKLESFPHTRFKIFAISDLENFHLHPPRSRAVTDRSHMYFFSKRPLPKNIA